MDTPENQPTPDQTQPPAGTPPTGTPPAQAPSGVGSAITGQPAGQPPTAPPNAAPNPVTAQPQGQTPAAQPQTPTDDHIGRFTKILRGLTPPTTYIDPTGQVQVMKQNAPSMGATIMSAVLAGMFAKNNYREGPYGPVLDRQATAADAFNAGQGVIAKQNAAAQKLSDDQQAKKLSYAAANLASMQNYAALEHTRFTAEKEGTEAEKTQSEFLQKQADQNNLTLGASADAYDQALTDKDAPKARLAQKATMDELLSGPYKSKMMQQLMVQDGVRSVYSEATGRTHTVPTYSLYNPDVELKLNKDAVDRAAKINPSFQGMYEVTGGNVPLNLARYAQITHQINSVDHAEDTLQSLSDSQDALAKNLGITGNVEGRLAAVVKGNPSAMKSLLEFENATAHGGNSADQLQRLLQSDGGDAIFKALGTDRDKVTDYIESYNNRIKAAREVANKAGAIAAQKAKPITFQTAAGIANDPNESPDRVATANAVILAHQTSAASTAAAVAKAQEPFKLRQQMQEQALRTGTPEEAGKLMANGDLTLTELKSRGSTPDFIVKATQAANAINPKYNAQKADAEYKIASNQANTTFFGSANSLLDKDGTLDQLAANYAKLENGQIPLFNKWADYAGYEAGDPAMAGFMQTAVGVADDYAKVMGGGTGSDTSRLQVMKSFANAHNPQQMASAIQAARDAVNSQTKSRMGSNGMLKKMYSSDSATNPNTPKTQFQAVSSDGKWGYDGKNWVSTTGAK